MANKRFNQITRVVTSFDSNDVLPIGNGTLGDGKMPKDTLLELTAQNALADNVAPAFVPNSTTTIAGQSYVYNGKLYVAKEAYQGLFDASKFYPFEMSDMPAFRAVFSGVIFADNTARTLTINSTIRVNVGKAVNIDIPAQTINYPTNFSQYNALVYNYGGTLSFATSSSDAVAEGRILILFISSGDYVDIKSICFSIVPVVVDGNYDLTQDAAAKKFNPNKEGGYKKGEIVSKDGNVYVFKNNHSGNWSDADVVLITFAGKHLCHPIWSERISFDNTARTLTINSTIRINVGNRVNIDIPAQIVNYPLNFSQYNALVYNYDGTLSFVTSSSDNVADGIVLLTFISDSPYIDVKRIAFAIVPYEIDGVYSEFGSFAKDKSLLFCNQFASWTNGYRIASDGTAVSNSNGAISNFISVTPGKSYYYRAARTNTSTLNIAGYSNNTESSFVSSAFEDSSSGDDAAKILRRVTIPAGVNYVRIQKIPSYDSDYGFFEIPHDGLLEASVKEFSGNDLDLLRTQENKVVEEYLLNTNYSSDTSYLTSDVATYAGISTQYVKSRPAPITIKWNAASGATSQVLDISESMLFDDAWSFTLNANASSYDVYNLCPTKKYYWRIRSLINSVYSVTSRGEVDVCGQCRMLYIDGEGTLNFRDLGGWKGLNGKRIKYGRLIRGAEIYREGLIEISAVGIDTLVDNLKINVELDFGDFSTYSPLENEGVEFIHGVDTYGIMGYNYPDIASIANAAGRVKFYNSLTAVITALAAGKNVYFHCNAGADRTGTFAFILEALLGVSESDLAKDYELTSFYTPRYRNVNVDGDYGYKSMVAWIKANYDGETLNDKVYDLCTRTSVNNGIGLSVDQVTELRTIMLDE